MCGRGSATCASSRRPIGIFKTRLRRERFREDLLYRLAAVSLRLPPLRQRREDVQPLCKFFLRRLGYPAADSAIDDSLAEELARRDWWGNVRELRNAIEHASVVARGRTLERADFPPPQLARRKNAGQTSSAILAWTAEAAEPGG